MEKGTFKIEIKCPILMKKRKFLAFKIVIVTWNNERIQETNEIKSLFWLVLHSKNFIV